MTVAAGFVCNEGVILCADTQETIPGYTKTDAQKLRSFECDPLNLFFAGSGSNSAQVEETIEEIVVNFREADLSTHRGFRRSLRETLLTLFPREYYPRSTSEVDLLMAVQSGQDVSLWRIIDCNFARVRNWSCVGAGGILGNQLLQHYYDWEVSLFEAAIISIYVLYRVKKSTDGCGGNTDIALIPTIGTRMSYMPSEEVAKMERYCEAHDKALQRLLTAAPRHAKNRAAFDNEVQQSVNGLVMARLAFQEYEETMREIALQLGWNYEQFMREAKEGAERFLNPPPSGPQT